MCSREALSVRDERQKRFELFACFALAEEGHDSSGVTINIIIVVVGTFAVRGRIRIFPLAEAGYCLISRFWAHFCGVKDERLCADEI